MIFRLDGPKFKTRKPRSKIILEAIYIFENQDKFDIKVTNLHLWFIYFSLINVHLAYFHNYLGKIIKPDQGINIFVPILSNELANKLIPIYLSGRYWKETEGLIHLIRLSKGIEKIPKDMINLFIQNKKDYNKSFLRNLTGFNLEINMEDASGEKGKNQMTIKDFIPYPDIFPPYKS